MIGLHFFNPAQRMQLLEIIARRRHPTRRSRRASLRAPHQEDPHHRQRRPRVLRVAPADRAHERFGLLMADASTRAIEAAMVDFGMPWGRRLVGSHGIDINTTSTDLREAAGERWKVHPLTEAIFKTAATAARPAPATWTTAAHARSQPQGGRGRPGLPAGARHPAEKSPPAGDVDLMLAAAITRPLHDRGGDLRPAWDMDLAMIYGTGFPAYSRGILRYADRWGAESVLRKLSALEQQYGAHFKPLNCYATWPPTKILQGLNHPLLRILYPLIFNLKFNTKNFTFKT